MDESVRRRLAPFAGPALIVASILVVLHLFAFSGLVSRQNPDVLALWLPTHCYLGSSLASGHIPAWNPLVMGGAPFAADPQSGWMYAPAMFLYSVFSCGTALRLFIVLQPVLAGLGLYWFLRSEGLSCPAATVGGLALGLPLAGSSLVLSLPFSATLAWTALLLAAASRLVRARTWPARLGWLVGTALAWGQLAAAHLSNGLVLGTGALLFFLAAKGVSDVRSRGRGPRHALSVGALLLVALPLVNLAYLLPRLAYLPRTTLGLGYDRLQILSRAYSGQQPVGHLPGGALVMTTPLRLVASPGLYLGAAALALTFAGWRSRRRELAAAFAAFGAVCFLFSLDAVADAMAPTIRHWPLGDFYLLEPSRFAFGIPLAVAVLAAVGVEGWGRGGSWRDRAIMVLPAVGVWLCLPLAYGVDRHHLLLFGAGAAGAAGALGLTTVRPALIALIPLALAGELVANGLAGQASVQAAGSGAHQQLRPLYPLLRPDVHIGDYLAPGRIAQALQHSDDGRYVSIDAADWENQGLHVRQDPRAWGLMATQRSMLFGIEEAQGYNATEERRYWVFLRAVDPRRIKYNAAYLMHPAPLALDLLQVGWIVSPTDDPPDTEDARAVVAEGRWSLYRVPSPPRAEVFTSWTPAEDGTEALEDLLGGRLDPTTTAVVELGGVGLEPERGSPGGTAVYRWLSPQEARIDVHSPGLALLVIHNSFDPNWHAEVDGRPVSVLHADYLLQGLFVSKGHHTVLLRYDDPSIGYGLLGSALALAALLGTALLLRWRSGRRTAGGARVAQSPANGTGSPHQAS